MASVGWAAARHKGATQLLGRRASTARVLCFCGCGQPAAQRGAWGCMTQACMWRLAFDTTPRCCDVVDELPDSEICIGARMCVRFRGGMRAPLFDFIRPDLLCMECRQDGCRVTVFYEALGSGGGVWRFVAALCRSMSLEGFVCIVLLLLGTPGLVAIRCPSPARPKWPTEAGLWRPSRFRIGRHTVVMLER